MLEAFVGPCPDGMECRHFPDRDPSNNNLSNLSWSTHKVNAQDTVTHGTCPLLGKDHRGERNPCSKLTNKKVRQARKMFKAGNSIVQIARLFTVSNTTMKYAISGRSWKHVR